MIKVVPFATALAAISAVCYLVGVLIALVAPGAFQTLMKTWLLLDVAGSVMLVTVPGFLVGLVTITVSAWLFGLAWAWLYNVLSHAEAARL